MDSPSNPFPDPDSGIDAIVRAQLDAEASRTDPGTLWEGVLHRLNAATTRPVEPSITRHRWRRAGTIAALAVLAALLFIGTFYVPSQREALASPAEVVQAARAVYKPGDTRCYRVTLTLPARLKEAIPLLAHEASPRTLCTRGDRFVVEPGFGGKGAWGRDATGRIWVAPTNDGVAVFDVSELPLPLQNAVKIHELELGPLLDDVLADFDLTWSEPPNLPADTYTITATRHTQAGPFRIASAKLVIERETKLIRSLTVNRQLLGESGATGVFNLISAVAKDDAAYSPESHVKPGAPVYDRSKPMQRRRFILQHIGSILGNGQ